MDQLQYRKNLENGIFFTAITKYSGIFISLVVTIFLSRLLTPEDFGTVAIASVFIVFFSIFSDMGMSSAIVQNRNLKEEDLISIFSFTLYTGLFLAILFFLSSFFIARFYANHQLLLICQVLSLNILFVTWNIVPNSILLREKKFKFIAIRTVVPQLFLALVSIIAALCGFGVYTLLINPIIGSLITLLLTYRKIPIKINLTPSFNGIKKIASYSSYSFGFSLINYFTRNLDKLMAGKFFGMTQLGYYEKSYRLMLLPVQNLTHVITPVLHPVLADYQDKLEFQVDKFLHLTKILALLGFPISSFLFFSAEDIIIYLYGNQWWPAIPIFQILSLTVGLQITGSAQGSIYLATNKTKAMFYVGIINTIINVSGLCIGVFVLKSITGVAIMWVVTMYLGLWNNWFIAKYVLNIPTLKAFTPFIPCILPTVLLSLSLLGCNMFTKEPNVINLIIKIILLLSCLLLINNKYHIIKLRRLFTLFKK